MIWFHGCTSHTYRASCIVRASKHNINNYVKNPPGGKCDTPSFLLRSPRVLWRGSLASRQRPCAAPHATRRLANNTAAMPPAPQRQQQHTAAYASCSNSAHSAATHCSQHVDTPNKQPASPPRLPSRAPLRAQTHAPAHQQPAFAQQIHAAYSISTSQCSSTLLAARALTLVSCPPYGERREPATTNRKRKESVRTRSNATECE